MPATKPKQSLKEYHRKRNFGSTPEPKGNISADAKRRRAPKALFFCVQKHLASHLHYDFRLEFGGVLLSWAVPKGPSLRPADKRLAMRVEDHPYDYGEFEGVIPTGYGAGIVMLWDRGTWTPQAGFDDIGTAISRGELKFTLDGSKLKGSWVLVRTRGGPGAREDAQGESRTWLLIKHRDEWAGDVDITTFAPKSIKSDKDFPEILAADKPDVWKSHRPAEGGSAGKMLKEIIEQAAELKAKKPAGTAKGRTTTRRAKSKPKTMTKRKKVAAKR